MASNGQVTTEKAKPADKPSVSTREIGVSGLDHYGGYLASHETIPQLRTGDQQRKVFREMADNDPVIGAVLFLFDMLMRQVEWSVTPAEFEEVVKFAKALDPSQTQAVVQEAERIAQEAAQRTGRAQPKPKPVHPEAKRAADLVSTSLDDMSQNWADTISQVLSKLVYGWSYFEILYKKREGADGEFPSRFNDGYYGWRKFAPRAQETLHKWEMDDNGGIKGMWQLAPGMSEPKLIPIDLSLLFRTTTHNNSPEGRSVLRNAYRPWYMKKRIEEIEGIGIERDLAGLPLLYVPPRWLAPAEMQTDEEKAAFMNAAKIVRNVKRDDNEGLLLPSYFDAETGSRTLELELLTSGGRRQFDTDAIIARYDQRIAMVALADFILLGHEKVGSYSLGASKVDLVSAALGAWLNAIAEVFNSHAIPRLLKANGLDPRLAPSIEPGKIESVDLQALGDYVSKLAGSGVPLFPDPILENFLRRQANMPEMEGAEEL